MKDSKCTKTAFSWTPSNGKKKQGRPRVTWRRIYRSDFQRSGVTWEEALRMAIDRDTWR